jgi:NhaP-type Na+/H+ or K+/H+ antiporter
MKAFFAIVLGLVLLAAPLWTLSGFVTVPQYRTGTMADFATALIAGATLYGGVLVGVLVSRKSRRKNAVPFRTTFAAGMAGAMGAITLALCAAALSQLVSTGRIMPAGQTPALLPVLYIVGGILSAFMAAGASLIAYGLGGASKAKERIEP